MHQSTIVEVAAGDAVLEGVQGTLGALAAGLDDRFVQAGTALANTYEIVERLIASLEGVANALDREEADAAIANMQSIADRLARLPGIQKARQGDLDAISQATLMLRNDVARIHRVLSFLRICGLNIKIVAAGGEEFSGFADNMFARLDLGEGQLAGFDRETKRLVSKVTHMIGVERQLSTECAKVIPHVPKKLAENALALQRHQSDTADLARRIAEVAREIRSKVGAALGAIQIGDITRQRLEHVAAGIATLRTVIAERDMRASQEADALHAQAAALFAAQVGDTLEHFRREAHTLTRSLRGIAPDASRLLALKQGDGGLDRDNRDFLRRLEQDIVEIETVTQQLRRADEETDRLGSATHDIAKELAERLKSVRKVQSDVEQMAWNTGLRCRRMGDDGLALAAIAAEVRQFATNLETVTKQISETFAELTAAAVSIRQRQEAGGTIDAGRALAESLASVRAGGERMRQNLTSLDVDAARAISMLRESTGQVDCEAEIGAALAATATQLAAIAADAKNLSAAGEEALADIFGRVARGYTMAREREVHVRVVPGGKETASLATAAPAQCDDDLFDDALF